MVEAPEKIWLSAADDDNERKVWIDPDEGGTEYVRADLLAGYGKLDAENAVLERQIAELRAELDEVRRRLLHEQETLQGHAEDATFWQSSAEALEAENARLRALPLKDEVERVAVKEIAMKFFRWWWNKPGANTDEGFDEWADTEGASLLSRLRAGEQEGRDGLSEWAGWDKTRDPWSETKHKDAVLEALFRGPWSVEDAAALIGFIDRTWTRRPSAPSEQGGDRG